jgi:hypothetical protein
MYEKEKRKRTRVLKVGHEAGGAGVECVDDHLSVDGSCDLHAPVLDGLGHRGHLPLGLSDVTCLLQKIRHLACLQLLLYLLILFITL